MLKTIQKTLSVLVMLGLIFPATVRAEGEWLVRTKGKSHQHTLWSDGSVTRVDLTKGDPKTDFHQAGNSAHHAIPVLEPAAQPHCHLGNAESEEELKKKKKAKLLAEKKRAKLLAERKARKALLANKKACHPIRKEVRGQGRPGVGHLIAPRPCDLRNKDKVREVKRQEPKGKSAVNKHRGWEHTHKAKPVSKHEHKVRSVPAVKPVVKPAPKPYGTKPIVS